MRGWLAWLVSVLVIFGGVEYVIASTRIHTENQVHAVLESVDQDCTGSDAAQYQVAPGDYTPAQVRSVFVDAGFDVSSVDCLTAPPARGAVFTVHDVQRNRVLRVEVYPDVMAAQIGQRRPRAGFTASTWMFNVALFEAQAVEEMQAASVANSAVERRYTNLLFLAAPAR